MKVKIGNNIYDSAEVPIAVLLTTDDEIKAANGLDGQKSRAIGSFPLGWDRNRAMIYLNDGWDGVTFKFHVDLAGALSSIPLPDPPRIRSG